MNEKVPSRILKYLRAFGIKVDSTSTVTKFSYENEILEKKNIDNTSWELFTKRQKRALFSTIGEREDGEDASFTFRESNCVIDIGQIVDSNDALEFPVIFNRGSQISSFYDLVIYTDTQGIHIILGEPRFSVGHIVISSSQPHYSASVYLKLLKKAIGECPRIGDTLDKNVLKVMANDPVVIQMLDRQINKMFTGVNETDIHNISK